MPIRINSKRLLKGLYSNFNHSAGIPEGGLIEADNCVLDRPAVLSKRTGFNRYGPESTSLIDSFMDYGGSLVVHSGTNISCDVDNDGSLTSWGDHYETPGGPHVIRGAGSKENLYFTSSDGVYRAETLSGPPTLAGMPEGLDIQLETYGSGAGWFLADKQVGYRVVWSRKDANDAVMVSEPSYRHTMTNRIASVSLTHDGEGSVVVNHPGHGLRTDDVITITQSEAIEYEGSGKTISVIDDDSYRFFFATEPVVQTGTEEGEAIMEPVGTVQAAAGKDYYVKLTFTIPEGIIAGDKYEIYRTGLSANALTDPGVDLMSVKEKEVTAIEIAAGTVVFSDETLEISLGDFLYTNAGQETISQRNTRPPKCKDIAEWKSHLFFADLTYKTEKMIHLSEIKDLENGDSISIKVEDRTLTYKFSGIENISSQEFRLNTTESTTEQNIDITARSLARVINRDPDNSLIYAHYASGLDDASGKVLIRARQYDATFSITTNREEVGDSFKEEIPIAGDTFASEADNNPHGLAYSKVLEPDSAPEINVIYVGNKAYPIQRIFALKTSMFILKADGIWRLSGNTPSSFLLQPLDPAVSIEAPNAAVELNDSVYCLASQGILKVGDNGTAAISFTIDDKMKNISSYSGYERISFAVASEDNRRLMVFTQKDSGDRVASVAWVYNYLTKEWTRWTKPARCGITLLGSRELYLGHTTDKFVLKERTGVSTRNSSNYMDEDIPVTVTVVAGTTITFTYNYDVPVREGFLFSQGGSSFKVKSVTSITGTNDAGSLRDTGTVAPYTVVVVLEDQPRVAFVTGAATVSLPIDSIVKWAPNNLGSSELPKQFTYAMITMESGTALTNELGFYTDAVPTPEWVGPIKLDTPTGWGKGAWGTSAWGNSDDVAVVPLTSPVPRQHQRCRELTLMYRHRVANEEFDIESVGFRVKAYKGKLVRIPE